MASVLRWLLSEGKGASVICWRGNGGCCSGVGVGRGSPRSSQQVKESKLNVVFLWVVGGMIVAGGMAPNSNTKYQFPPRCQCTFFTGLVTAAQHCLGYCT